MKCFDCNAKCFTVYLDKNLMAISSGDTTEIFAVSKLCRECGWFSHPTKIPVKLE